MQLHPIFQAVFWLFAVVFSSASWAQDRVTLQLKWHHQFQFAGYYAAQALGYYAEAGLDVTIRPVDLNENPADAVLRDQAQFGIASTDLLLLRNRGAPVVALASVFQHSPYVLLAMRRNGIESVHDLVGKKVMLDPFATEVLAYLKSMGVPVESLQIIQANDYTYDDLLNGRADAYAGYITNDPWYLDQQGANYLSFLPRSVGIDFYGDTLYTTEAQIRQHPERVTAFRQASLRGWEYAVRHPEQVIELMMKNGWARPEERSKLGFEAAKVIQLIRPDLVEIGYSHAARWQHVLNTYADMGMLPRNMSLEGFLYGETAPLLPRWALVALLLISVVAAASGGMAAWVHRNNQKLAAQITQREQAEHAELKLAGAVYQSLGDALLLTDESHRIVRVNDAFARMTGYRPDELTGRHPGMLLSEQDSVDLFDKIQRGLTEAGQWSGDVHIIGKDGQATPIHLFMRLLRDETGQPLRHIGILSPIEHRKSQEDTLWNSIHLDAITGLPNRTLFLKTLQDRLEHPAEGQGAGLTLLLLDIDRFQEVNEVLGHPVGDQVLNETARRLRRCLPPQAFLARLGGDEFAIMVPGPIPPAPLENLVQSLLGVMTEPFSESTLPFYLSASIGIARYPQDADSVGRLIQLSEQAMYVAKDNGRNRRVYFSAAMQESVLERVRLTNDLRQALPAGQLHIEYQPIVSLRSGRMDKAEALLRWRHPEEGWISPARFIPMAERSGLIQPISQWIFRQACEQLVRWRAIDPQLQLSINKSPLEFHGETTLLKDDVAFMQSIGLPGQAVAVEITEGLLLDTSDAVVQHLALLQASGVRLSLDDFGTGYSSMAYLQKIDIGFLKIDRAFVRQLETNEADQALCRAMVTMAHSLGIQVIAEGVETLAQARLLANMDCDYAQGFYFSRPLPPDDFARLLGSVTPTVWRSLA